ncbi:MAG: alpha/beta hydrolase domain-containing protein, partial [Chloroflexota bacterium]|nr:alpha/beta hydrolase domain-containing protein [Chloroflexota bacterium]
GERSAAHDPRPSITERYESRDAYLEQVREAAHKLASERYILDEDVEICVADAITRYDEAMKK